jgi:hypothetical protein
VLGSQPASAVRSADEDQPGNDAVVVLSHPLWQNRRPDPKTSPRDPPRWSVRHRHRVMPAGEDRLLWGQIDAWRPLAWDAKTRQHRGGNWLSIISRLKPGISSRPLKLNCHQSLPALPRFS